MVNMIAECPFKSVSLSLALAVDLKISFESSFLVDDGILECDFKVFSNFSFFLFLSVFSFHLRFNKMHYFIFHLTIPD